MTVDNARRHLPKSIQTSMGHLARVIKNVRSTKETEPTVDELMNEEEKEPEIIPPGKQPLNREHQVGIHVIYFEKLKGVIAIDQTGRFLITSQLGNAYIMVLYDFNYNAILATGIKSRKKEHLIEGFKEVHRELTDAGIVPQLVKLDNEA